MPGARARSVLARIPLGRTLVAVGVVLVVINVASAVWDVRTAYDRVERRAQRDLTNMTRVLAEQTAASLEAVDVVLRDMARGDTAKAVAERVPRLRDDLANVSTIAALLVLDAQGKVLARTGGVPAIDADPTRHPFFAAHRNGSTDGLHLSEPYREGTEDGRWRFLLSRRLNDRAGRFGGVVAAAIEVESFDRLYRTIDLGDGSFIALLSEGGTFLSRVPAPPGIRGRQIPEARGIVGVREQGRFEGWSTSPVTNEPVLLSALAVRGFPLFVASGASERAVLAPWRDEAWQVFDRTLLTSGAMLALIAFAAWGLARRERALASSWRKYQAMIEHSSDALILTRPTDRRHPVREPGDRTGARLHPGRPARPGSHRPHPPGVPRRGAQAARRADALARQGVGGRDEGAAQGRLLALDRAHPQQPARGAERAGGGHELPRHHRAQAGRGRAAAAGTAAAAGRRRWRRSAGSPAASPTTSTTSSAASSATRSSSPRTRLRARRSSATRRTCSPAPTAPAASWSRSSPTAAASAASGCRSTSPASWRKPSSSCAARFPRGSGS